MRESVIAFLAIASPMATMVFGYLAFLRNQKQDASRSASQGSQMMVEIGYIKSGIDELKRKQEQSEERYTETISRVVAVEASVKQAHHRIDTIEHNCETRREGDK